MLNMVSLDDINDIIENSLINIKWNEYDKPECCFKRPKKYCKASNNGYCISNETLHICKHLITGFDDEHWGRIIKKRNKSIRTKIDIKEQFKKNYLGLSDIYENIGKEVIKQRYAILEEFKNGSFTKSSTNVAFINFIGKADLEGALTFTTFNMRKSNLKLNSIFCPSDKEWDYKSDCFIAKAFYYTMEKKGKVKWIVEPMEVKFLRDRYEYILNIESIDKLAMLLLQRSQELISDAEQSGDIEDIFDSIKALISLKAYNYNYSNDYNKIVLEKLNKVLLAEELESRIMQTFKFNRFTISSLNERYEKFYKTILQTKEQIEKEDVGQDLKYYELLMWKFCYNWTSLNLVYQNIENLKSSLNPTKILENISFSEDPLFKENMKANDLAWELSKDAKVNMEEGLK